MSLGAAWQAEHVSRARHLQQCVSERLAAELGELGPLVVAVAGHAVLFDQLLVERDLDGAARDRHTLGGLQPDIGHGVALGTARRRCAAPGAVAGEAVGRQLLVTLDQRPGRDHQVRVDERERHQHHEVECNDDP